jgi:putative radical SAM enzyme (TIGR03279 family)
VPLPRVVAVADASPAALAGVQPGDEIRSMNGRVPRDVIEYQYLADEGTLELEITRGGLERRLVVSKLEGEPLGIEVSSPVFDRVRTCDNHCAFCFIHQLPRGLRRSLYVKDDDYRLSFLYGNFTTLTRFTESDLERVVTERLSPLYVSIHACDPEVRARLLRNPRGATSLRFLELLLEAGIEVHGQVVVCPGVNDGDVLHETFAGVLDRFPALASLGVVPLGVSRYSSEPEMRPHRPEEAAAVLDAVEAWQEVFLRTLGRRLVHAADEYYLLAARPFPPLESYEGLPQHENGIGMAAAFVAAFEGRTGARRPRGGFFASLEAAPATGYRAPRLASSPGGEPRAPRVPTGASVGREPTVVLTGEYGAAVLAPLVAASGAAGEVEVVAVRNELFGGNVAVAGLLGGAEVDRALAELPAGTRVLLPDVCLSQGRFLDGLAVEELSRPVEVVPSDGASLRRALRLDAPRRSETAGAAGPRARGASGPRAAS